MRKPAHPLAPLLLLATLATTLGQTTPATPAKPDPSPSATGLQLTLDRADHATLEVTLQNLENKPVVLNLGDMLGNGITLIPSQLHLEVTAADGKPRQLTWKPTIVGGRMDPFLVPLMPGSKYGMLLSLDDFTDAAAKTTLHAGDKVRVVFEGAPLRPTDVAIPALPMWTNKVESEAVAYAP